MREEITILGLDERERWESEHRIDGLPSQSWTYARGLSLSGYEPRLAVVRQAGARMLLPFFERRWDDAVDIATLPGLSGASLTGGSQGPVELWREYASSRGWITGYLQLATHAVLDHVPPPGELVTHNVLFVFDTRIWDERRSVSANFRHQKIYEGRRRAAELVEDRTRLAAAMVELYPDAMRRLGGRAAFSAATLRQWIEDRDALVLGAAIEDRIEAVHLGRLAGPHAEWHIAATSEHGRSLGAWLIWCGLQQARRQGALWSNIGGGARIGDSIHAHKARFHATQMPLRSLRQVYRPERYRQLCEKAGVRPDAGRFPAYWNSMRTRSSCKWSGGIE